MPAILEEARPQTVCTSITPVVKVALAGCGVVGSELVRLLTREADHIQQRHGVRFELTRVLIRDAERPRDVTTSRELFTTNVDHFLEAPADIVVEAIGGLHPALRIAQSAVQRGARFITANKALIAAHGVQLRSSAATRGAQLQFEAAVGGSVPVIRVLSQALGTARPRAIRGILNGTSNFVLTRVEEGLSLSAAIAEAQQRGLAEADPSRDLDGRDAEDKISILAWLAYGLRPDHVRATRRGLLPDLERSIQDAKAIDAKVRLIAECVVRDNDVYVNVEPVIVGADSAFGRTVRENNLILLDFGWGAPVQLAGPGAGGAPTATALLGDLLQATAPFTVPSDPPACVADQRAHSWSVSVRRYEKESLRRFEAAGIGVRIVQWRSNAFCIHAAPVSRARLADVLLQLEQIGASPVATRLDASEAY